MNHKPLFFGYEKPGVTQVHGLSNWLTYESLREMHPYVQQGPLTIPRNRPIANNVDSALGNVSPCKPIASSIRISARAQCKK